MTRSILAVVLGAVVAGGCIGPVAPALPHVYRVGWLSGNSASQSTLTDALRQALRDAGYVEGRNLDFVARYADGGKAELYAAAAADFVALKVDVIVVKTLEGARAVEQATHTIPIVVVSATNDPVADGLVTDLARPGGNVTGTMSAGPELAQRRLQLLKETMPSVSRVAYFVVTSNASSFRGFEEARGAAPALGVTVSPFDVSGPEKVPDALEAAERAHSDAVVVGATFPITEQARLVDFLTLRRLPSMISVTRSYVDRGALLYYDESQSEQFKAVANYVDRILRGASPGELPIAKATRFDFVINMKTAAAIGVTIPPSVLAQATELIQ